MTKGTYTFKWSEPASEVFVTGSFDNWTKSEKLHKTEDGSHIASVELEVEKTKYKYVVDTNWVVDPKGRIEKDDSGNDNNYLLPEDIVPKEEPTFSTPVIPDTANDETAAPFVQSAGPTSTTAALAAEVPLEPKRDLAAEAAAKKEEPEPVTEAAVVAAQVEEPAKVEDEIIKVPEVPKEEPVEAPAGAPVDPTIQSVAPESTTAALAAEVPLETKVNEPPIVPEAIKAVAAPEDLPTPDPKNVPGFLPDTVDTAEEKEETVKVNPIPASETATNPITLAPGEEVPPSTASVTDNVKLDQESYEKADASNLGVGATAAAALAAVTAAVSEAAAHPTETIKNLIPESVLPLVPIIGTSAATATTETVPPVVVESQEKAAVEPEASAVPEVVEAKKEVEDELIAKTEIAAPIAVTTETPRADVPEVVRESQAVAEAPLEASASPVAVEAKKEIEAELKGEVKPVEPIPETPAEKPSEPEAVPAIVAASIEKAGASSEATASPAVVEAKAAVEEAITKGETKVETLEPPKKEEPVAEKASDAAEKVADKAEKAVDAVVPEAAKTEDKPTEPAATSSTTSNPAKEKSRRKRLSAFFHRIVDSNKEKTKA